jgi:hypothetical protein
LRTLHVMTLTPADGLIHLDGRAIGTGKARFAGRYLDGRSAVCTHISRGYSKRKGSV